MYHSDLMSLSVTSVSTQSHEVLRSIPIVFSLEAVGPLIVRCCGFGYKVVMSSDVSRCHVMSFPIRGNVLADTTEQFNSHRGTLLVMWSRIHELCSFYRLAIDDTALYRTICNRKNWN